MTDGGRIIDLVDTGKIRSLRFPAFWFEPTPQGKFMLTMAFGQGKYYVDSMSENTKRGFREKIRIGEYPGIAPLGYLNDRRIKRIIPDPDRAPVIRQVFERYAAGSETLDTLRVFLATNGVTTKTGKLLTRDRITKMLKNPIYYGHFMWAGDVHAGKHEAIVSKVIFDRVQCILSQRWKKESPPLCVRGRPANDVAGNRQPADKRH
ncbi:MAG TPA: recombinase family protein [Opitutus sp.]|nr:recombinase family protein [Opitutus sp.]